MTRNEAQETTDDDLLFADGYDEAIIGVSCPGPNRPSIVVYDVKKCIEILVQRDGMEIDEAEEFFEFNTVGAYVGEKTPIYVRTE